MPVPWLRARTFPGAFLRLVLVCSISPLGTSPSETICTRHRVEVVRRIAPYGCFLAQFGLLADCAGAAFLLNLSPVLFHVILALAIGQRGGIAFLPCSVPTADIPLAVIASLKGGEGVSRRKFGYFAICFAGRWKLQVLWRGNHSFHRLGHRLTQRGLWPQAKSLPPRH